MSSPTIFLRGIREIDDEFEIMLAVRDACVKARVIVPDKVAEYFGGDYDEGVPELFNRKFAHDIIGVNTAGGGIVGYATDQSLFVDNGVEVHEDSYLYTIDLKKLPTALETLQLEISW